MQIELEQQFAENQTQNSKITHPHNIQVFWLFQNVIYM